MLNVDLKTDRVDTNLALNILQRYTDDLGIFVDLDICTDYIAYLTILERSPPLLKWWDELPYIQIEIMIKYIQSNIEMD